MADPAYEDRDQTKYRDLSTITHSPSLKNVLNMIMKVRFRSKYTTKEKDIHSHAMIIENDLNDFEVDYQSISIKESNSEEDEPSYLQIICNDAEEREHIKHLLLKNKYILCFEVEQKRYFPKMVEQEEKDHFKSLMEYHRKKKEEKRGQKTEEEKKLHEAIRHE